MVLVHPQYALAVTSTIISTAPPGHGWHRQGRGDNVGHFFPPTPPLCEHAAVRGDIVSLLVGSTKRWLCLPPYKNSRLSSFFLEVAVFLHTRAFVVPTPCPKAPTVRSVLATNPKNCQFGCNRSKPGQFGRKFGNAFLNKQTKT